jgi:hypothetical protein
MQAAPGETAQEKLPLPQTPPSVSARSQSQPAPQFSAKSHALRTPPLCYSADKEMSRRTS